MANIGKNVIENLTAAMYENSYTVYREYIQNAADAIDNAVEQGLIEAEEAIVDISIDYRKRKINIFDNATGISSAKFVEILTNIADSQKDKSKDKGFRGIGRLAGVAYCDKLVFRSSYVGEDVASIIEWDGVKLREILGDPSQHLSASEVVDEITNSRTEKCKKDQHFFEVIMENVISESDDLLNEHEVIEYLRAVAPVPFPTAFIFKSKIKDFCEKEDFDLDEYNVQVNGNQIFKQYGTIIYSGTEDNRAEIDEIKDIEFRIFKDPDGNKLAWMWFAITRFEKAIPTINKMRCIRMRKGNIQIGDEITLGRFFSEARGNSYYIGEVHALTDKLVPNARRDYFNLNESLRNLENELRPVFETELKKIYHYANNVKKAYQRKTDLQKKEREYEEKVTIGGFINEEERIDAEKEIEKAQKQVEKDNRTLELREKDAAGSSVLRRVYSEIEKTYKLNEIAEEQEKQESQKQKSKKENQKKYLSQNLSGYSRKEQKLISRIYAIIKAVLPRDMAEMLVAKIQEELSK